MSCFVMSSKKTAQLADFLVAVCDHGFDYFGFDCPNALRKELHDCYIDGWLNHNAVFRKLVRLNNLAYNGRYHDETGENFIPYMPDAPKSYHPKQSKEITKDNGFKDFYTLIEPWHYQIFKTLQCYIYQLSEDATTNAPFRKALTELERVMALFIIRNQPDYVTAEWG